MRLTALSRRAIDLTGADVEPRRPKYRVSIVVIGRTVGIEVVRDLSISRREGTRVVPLGHARSFGNILGTTNRNSPSTTVFGRTNEKAPASVRAGQGHFQVAALAST
jgi:hypothetical protein